jgi:type II secretory pathway pseudopilin PulG
MSETPSTRNHSIAIVVLAILSLVFAILFFMKSSDVVQNEETISNIELEQLQLKSDLQEMLIQYDTLNVANDQLTAEMLAQQEQIREMLKQIEKHKDDAWIINKLKKEAATLREIMKGYVVTIDSLNTLNVDLRRDNQFLSEELSEVMTKAQTLEKEKEGLQSKVATGSILRAKDISVSGVRMRNNGKQVDVNRAKQTEMIRTCATIDENRIAEAGKKTLYLRIISPDGVVLDAGVADDGRFDFEGVSGKYSVKRAFDYTSESQELCVFYNIDAELPTGKYIVEIYEGGAIIGKSELDLK